MRVSLTSWLFRLQCYHSESPSGMTFSVALSKPGRLASWLLWASLAVHVPIAVVAVGKSKLPNADLDNYYDIGTRAGRPYVDFPVEFPVATTETFRTLAPIAGDREQFGVSLVILSVAADVAIALALGWGWGIEAAACYAFIVIPLIDLFFLRMDLWPTALATFAAAAWRRERPVLAAIGWVAGAAFKLWPLMFLPLLLVSPGARRRITPLATAIAAGLMVVAGWLWVAGPSGLYQVLTFRGAQGWEIESTVGAVWMLFEQTSMRVESGAWRIGTTSGQISILLFVLGAIPCLWMIWRGGRTGHLGAGWAGGISARARLPESAHDCVGAQPAPRRRGIPRDTTPGPGAADDGFRSSRANAVVAGDASSRVRRELSTGSSPPQIPSPNCLHTSTGAESPPA
jgi:hypothetical protein